MNDLLIIALFIVAMLFTYLMGHSAGVAKGAVDVYEKEYGTGGGNDE